MNEINYPTQSTKTLIKASFAASIIAVTIFIVIVLPSEYNIDPTGLGKQLGLTALAEATEVESKEASQEASTTEEFARTEKTIIEHEVVITVPANRGLEYKFKMQQYDNITYEWKTDGSPLHHDFHGEPEGDTSGYFESYTITTTNEINGSMTVPFNGVHGWYWKNTTNADIKVTLKVKGVFDVVGYIH